MSLGQPNAHAASRSGGPISLPVPLRHGVGWLAWSTVLRVSVQQFVRGRRLLALAALFTLPILVAIATRYDRTDYGSHRAEVEEAIVFYMIPQTLIPLTALILASGMIRDEVEGQTLTYLLIRPIPRPLIYLAKLLAAWLVSAGLAAVFSGLVLVVINWGFPNATATELGSKVAKVAAIGATSMWCYVVLFGAMSLIVRWVLPLGVAYIALIEGVFANIDFVFRRVTVLWYVRLLAERWLGIHVESWSIDLAEAPSGLEAFTTLMVASAVLAGASAWWFGSREIRMKTPEGS
ncbi:MAG: ABC transporter permease [Isosphaeraceae bacterium]